MATHPIHHRLRHLAARRRERATRPEDAPGVGPHQIRQAPRDRRQPPRMRPVRAGQGGQQPLRVRMPRPAQHLSRRPPLRHPARIQHRHLVRQPVDDPEVMAHQQHRQPPPAPEIVEQREDLRLDRHIQRRGGLVQQQKVGLGRQRRRDADALLHAPRQLVRIIPHRLRRTRNAHLRQQRRRPRPRLGLRSAQMHDHRLRQLMADAERRVQRRGGVLEHRADPPPAQRGRIRQQIMPVERHPPRPHPRGPGQPQQRQHDARLPRPALAHQPQHAPARDLERHPIERLQPPARRGIRDRKRLDREQGLRHRGDADRAARAAPRPPGSPTPAARKGRSPVPGRSTAPA